MVSKPVVVVVVVVVRLVSCGCGHREMSLASCACDGGCLRCLLDLIGGIVRMQRRLA